MQASLVGIAADQCELESLTILMSIEFFLLVPTRLLNRHVACVIYPLWSRLAPFSFFDVLLDLSQEEYTFLTIEAGSVRYGLT